MSVIWYWYLLLMLMYYLLYVDQDVCIIYLINIIWINKGVYGKRKKTCYKKTWNKHGIYIYIYVCVCVSVYYHGILPL